MSKDLYVATVLAALCAFLAVAGFFLWDWSPILVGLLVAGMIAADGYLVLGLIRQSRPKDEEPGRKSPPIP